MKLLNSLKPLGLNKNKKYLLACSGGPDSMALFGMLLKENYDFDVAFVNYKTRKESDLEQELVSQICEKHCKTSFIFVQREKIGGNFEQGAREVRYNFFKNIYDQYKDYEALLIAHNADDFIETYLMQKERNNKPLYFGIKYENNYKGMKILRPVMCYEKKFLTNYCEENNIPYSIDVTNFDNSYQRNNIRNNILSKYTIEQKQVIVDEIDDLNHKIEEIYQDFDKHIEGNRAINIENIEELQRFLFYFLSKQGITIKDSSFKNIIFDIKAKNYNKVYNFTKSLLLFDNLGLLFTRKDLSSINYEYSIDEFNKIFKVQGVDSTCKIVPLKNYKSFICNGHTKKVSRFFIDTKMPLSYRLIWPCVINENGVVIYTPRYRENFVQKEDSKLIFSAKTLQNLNI